MGEFNFEKAMAMAKAIKSGEQTLPERSARPERKPSTSFDFQAAVDRAKQKQTTKTEDLEKLP